MRSTRFPVFAAIALTLAIPGARADDRDGKISHLISEYYRAAPTSAAQTVGLSPRESEELRDFLAREPENTPVAVDLSDPAEARMEDLIDKAAGRPPFSALVKALAAAGEPARVEEACAEVLKDHNAQGLFADAGSEKSGETVLLTAATLQAVSLQKKPEAVRNFAADLTVFDSDQKMVSNAKGLSAKNQVILLTQDAPKRGAFRDASPPVAQAYFTVFKEDGTPCQTRRLAKITPPPKRISVPAPNNTQNRTTIICLNRGNPEPGWPQACDFGPFPQSGIDHNVAQVVVPLAGTIETPYPIAAKTITTDITLQVTAINTNNGETCKGQDNDLGGQVLTKATVAGTTLNWNIVGNQALTFGKTCYASNTGLAFNMYWTVPVTMPDQSTQNITAIVSNVLQQGSANTLIIRPANLQFGCVAGGTMVTLADGTTRKAVENITPEDRVLGLDGKPWAVTGHMKGEDVALIAVRAANGFASRMTPDHPVITGYDASGKPEFVMAKNIVVGTKVFTEKGASDVVAVEHQAYTGFVYNMEVRPLGASAVPAGGGGFYADGLLVGDQTMQGLATKVAVAGN